MKLELDSTTIKALSSKTRTGILKLLGQRRYMQTELAELLNLSVPTVKEHLDALERAGLVEKHDEGRKWKYYSLTKKGKAVLQPSETTILLVLGLTILSIIGGFLTTARNFAADAMQRTAIESTAMEAVVKSTAVMPSSQWSGVFAILTIILATILALLLQQYKLKSLGKSLNKK